MKGIRKISGGGDGAPNIVPQLLHQSNLDSKFISLIDKKLITTEFVIAMSNKVESRDNLSKKSVILRPTKQSTKQPTCKSSSNNLVTKPMRLHAHVDNETEHVVTTSTKKEIKFHNATLSGSVTTTVTDNKHINHKEEKITTCRN